MSTLQEAQQLWEQTDGRSLPRGFHFCFAEHHCIEQDGTCKTATTHGDDDFLPGRLFWIGLYLQDRVFGGREKGGWYYATRTFVTDGEVYSEIGTLPSVHTHRTDAVLACSRMRLALDSLNDGRPSTSSVRSISRYDAEIHEGSLPVHYPLSRPRYE